MNDVLLFQKKVSGILTEQIWTKDGRRAVIIGIGINVHQRNFPPEIADIATSVYLALTQSKADGRMRGRKELTETLWRNFTGYYERFVRKKDLAFVMERYNERLINRGRRCRILDPKGAYEGTALGIDEAGRLSVRTDGGAVRAVDSGEVSVRGIMGYV